MSKLSAKVSETTPAKGARRRVSASALRAISREARALSALARLTEHRDLVGVVAVVEAGEDLAGLDLLAAGDGELDDAPAHLEGEVHAGVGVDDAGEVQRRQCLRGADDDRLHGADGRRGVVGLGLAALVEEHRRDGRDEDDE